MSKVSHFISTLVESMFNSCIYVFCIDCHLPRLGSLGGDSFMVMWASSAVPDTEGCEMFYYANAKKEMIFSLELQMVYVLRD